MKKNEIIKSVNLNGNEDSSLAACAARIQNGSVSAAVEESSCSSFNVCDSVCGQVCDAFCDRVW